MKLAKPSKDVTTINFWSDIVIANRTGLDNTND